MTRNLIVVSLQEVQSANYFRDTVMKTISCTSYSQEIKLFGHDQPDHWKQVLPLCFIEVRNVVSDADKIESLGEIEHYDVKLKHLFEKYMICKHTMLEEKYKIILYLRTINLYPLIDDQEFSELGLSVSSISWQHF